jgi:hypothetical protein
MFPCSFYGTFYIFIPQAIDQRIQHWNNECIKYRRHFISIKGMTGLGLHEYRYQRCIEDYDHCQVGPTGGESLAPPLCRAHLENSYKDEQVGHKDQQKRGNQIKSCKDHNE